MNEPIAVCISDIHFNLNTLEIATEALQAAIKKSIELKIPLIIAGDLHDTKANIRAEVANRLLELFIGIPLKVYIIVGNHDLINEKGSEHGLNYLSSYATIIDKPTKLFPDLWCVPYQNSSKSFLMAMTNIKIGSIVIAHQGFKGAMMGDYLIDISSADYADYYQWTIISGHYHRHQTIGTVTYIGSPYTITYGEANDGPKGFIILNSDGSFTREILNFRKHIIIEGNIQTNNNEVKIIANLPTINKNDLLWLKVKGPESELKKLNKNKISKDLNCSTDFKLELIPNKIERSPDLKKFNNLSNQQKLIKLIEQLNETDEHKIYLKELSNEIIES